MTRKTPSRWDDFFILMCGVVLVAVPLARILGLFDIHFDYLEVTFGAVLPVTIALGKWVMFVRKYLSETTGARTPMPDPITALLVAMALFHFLPIWQVTRVAENAWASNLWLSIMTYFLAAAVLGRYLWPLEFLSLIFGMGEKVASIRATRQSSVAEEADFPEVSEGQPVVDPTLSANAAVTPTALYMRPTEPVPLQQRFVEMPPLDEHRPDPMPEALVTRPSVAALMPAKPLSVDPVSLIDRAMGGDTTALEQVVGTLNRLDRGYLQAQLTAASVPSGVIQKIFVALDGDNSKLLEVMSHPAFASRQRPVFIELIS